MTNKMIRILMMLLLLPLVTLKAQQCQNDSTCKPDKYGAIKTCQQGNCKHVLCQISDATCSIKYHMSCLRFPKSGNFRCASNSRCRLNSDCPKHYDCKEASGNKYCFYNSDSFNSPKYPSCSYDFNTCKSNEFCSNQSNTCKKKQCSSVQDCNLGQVCSSSDEYKCITDVKSDRDFDGVPDAIDNCASKENPAQIDTDGDKRGDKCDDDIDNDGVKNKKDNCPKVKNRDQRDLDKDGIGNACDTDRDGDRVMDYNDECPLKAAPPTLPSGCPIKRHKKRPIKKPIKF